MSIGVGKSPRKKKKNARPSPHSFPNQDASACRSVSTRPGAAAGRAWACMATTAPPAPALDFCAPRASPSSGRPQEYAVRQVQRVATNIRLRDRRKRGWPPSHLCTQRPQGWPPHRVPEILAHRAGLLERAAARICREAGARVATSVALRDLNLDVPATDGRKMEVVANGLPLWQGAQVAVDTTLVNSLQRDGQPRPGADARPGLALAQAAARKHRNPELQTGGRERCRFVVVDLEAGGRFSGGGLALPAGWRTYSAAWCPERWRSRRQPPSKSPARRSSTPCPPEPVRRP